MSPGATFERVYRELKRQLCEGLLSPGAPIEPAVVGAELAASSTPVRDALHRLVGERLVEASQYNGFRVPRPTEAELRDLYLWNGRVVGLAVANARFEQTISNASQSEPEDIATVTAMLFLQIGDATRSREHIGAIAELNDRLGHCRRAEAIALGGLRAEYDALRALVLAGERARLGRGLMHYHQRRAAETPLILATMVRTGGPGSGPKNG